MDPKLPLFGKDLAQLQEIAAAEGMPRFAAGQIASWLYKKGAAEIAQMSDLSLRHREALAERYVAGRTPPAGVAVSADGTKKYLFELGGAKPEAAEPDSPGPDGAAQGSPAGCAIESAYIPDRERATLCVSSQAGCRMGCRFCATGAMGFVRDLSAGEILNQVASIPESAQLTNLVYMGMGEPLDNLEEVVRSLDILTAPWGWAWSPTRITVSTAGVLPALDELLTHTKVHIAISLHNPLSDQRAAIMPLQNAQPIEKIVAALRRHDFAHQRRLSFEYIVMEGLNDSPAHIKELARLLNGLPCRINLIRFHKIPGSPYFSPPQQKMEAFRDALTAKGFTTTIRPSRGEDSEAACGLLSTNRK
ncbi:MAG: radical SAM protein [Rikenellaceae bacterium]|jgi:23S rRNA (adenine2503-C2)-methyltransferase|nr:radical SAM protein [Rikenellaceae bacterium]